MVGNNGIYNLAEGVLAMSRGWLKQSDKKHGSRQITCWREFQTWVL